MSVLRSTMHSPPEPAQIVWGTCFGQQQTGTQARLSSKLTASGRTITCSGLPCWSDWMGCQCTCCLFVVVRRKPVLTHICVTQAERGGQGDPLMPLLFSTGMHSRKSPCCCSQENNCAPVGRRKVANHCTRGKQWNKSQLQPTNVDNLGPDVWQPQRIIVLGTPSGQRTTFVRR